MAFKWNQPATYRIRIQGSPDRRQSSRLGSMVIRETDHRDGAKVTTLSGRLPDQVALFGVLITLCDFHLPMLSVERVDTE